MLGKEGIGKRKRRLSRREKFEARRASLKENECICCSGRPEEG
jgi:hypothetical protein